MQPAGRATAGQGSAGQIRAARAGDLFSAWLAQQSAKRAHQVTGTAQAAGRSLSLRREMVDQPGQNLRQLAREVVGL